MNRRDFIGVFVSAGIWQTVAQAQEGRRIPRVGYVDYEPPAATKQGLLIGLRELGYVQNQTIRLVRNKLPVRL